jgi:PAS domain S-box-containing protein
MTLSDPAAFRLIFEDAPIGICVVDSNLKIVDVNAAYCEMLGYTEAEVMELRVPDYTHPDDRQRDAEFLPLLLSGQVPTYKAEKRYIAKDGSIVYAEIVVTPIVDDAGTSRYAFSIVKNVIETRAIRRMLPVCPSCRRVRDPQGLWLELKTFVRRWAEAEVREDRCPECSRGEAG